MHAYLKVKLCGLAEEAKTIRRLQRKLKKRAHKQKQTILQDFVEGDTRSLLFWGLDEHRKAAIRRETRHTHLAYGFLRGVPYSKMEFAARSLPDWEKVHVMVKKFAQEDPRVTEQKWAQFLAENKEWGEKQRSGLLSNDQAKAMNRQARYITNNSADARVQRRREYAPGAAKAREAGS